MHFREENCCPFYQGQIDGNGRYCCLGILNVCVFYITVAHGRRKHSKVTILMLWVFRQQVVIFIHYSKLEQNSEKFS